MSARRVWALCCDVLGCDVTFTSLATTAWETRRDGFQQGWRHVLITRPQGGPADPFDTCPAHAGERALRRKA